MRYKSIQCQLHILFTCLTIWNNNAAKQILGAWLMLLIPYFHWPLIIISSCWIIKARCRKPPVCRSVTHPGKNLSKLRYHRIVISGNIIPLNILTAGPIHLQFPQSNREKLHYLTSEVFIRKSLRRHIGFAIIHMGQIEAHGRAISDMVENIPITAKCLLNEWIIVGCMGKRIIANYRARLVVYDQNLAECISHSMTQLIIRDEY